FVAGNDLILCHERLLKDPGAVTDLAAEHNDGVDADVGVFPDSDRSQIEPAVLDRVRFQGGAIADTGAVADLDQVGQLNSGAAEVTALPDARPEQTKVRSQEGRPG